MTNRNTFFQLQMDYAAHKLRQAEESQRVADAAAARARMVSVGSAPTQLGDTSHVTAQLDAFRAAQTAMQDSIAASLAASTAGYYAGLKR